MIWMPSLVTKSKLFSGGAGVDTGPREIYECKVNWTDSANLRALGGE